MQCVGVDFAISGVTFLVLPPGVSEPLEKFIDRWLRDVGGTSRPAAWSMFCPGSFFGRIEPRKDKKEPSAQSTP